MNFFNEYSRKKKSANKMQLIIGAIVILAVAAFTFGTLYFINMRTEADKRVSNLQSQLADTEASRERLRSEQERLAVYRQVYDALEAIDITLSHVNFFTGNNVRTILNAMPEGVTIEAFVLKDLSLDVSGYLDSMGTLASLLQNLEDTGLFILVTPSNAVITSEGIQGEEEEAFMFTVSCTLRGVSLR